MRTMKLYQGAGAKTSLLVVRVPAALILICGPQALAGQIKIDQSEKGEQEGRAEI